MPELSHDTRLRWIDDPRVRLDPSTDSVTFSAGNRAVRTDPTGTALPDLFRKPATTAVAGQPDGARVVPASPGGEGAAPDR